MELRSSTTAIAAMILLAASCATPSEPVPTVTAAEPAVAFLVPECEDPNGCEPPPPPPPPSGPPNCPTSALVYAGSRTSSGPTTVAVTVEAPHTISSTCANYTVWKATVDGIERPDATYYWYYGVCRSTQGPDGWWADWNNNWCTTDQFTLVDSGLGKSRFTIPVWADVRNVFVYVEASLGNRTGVSGAVKSRGPLNGLHPEPNPSRDIKNCGVFGLPHRYYDYANSAWRAFGRNYCTGQDSSVRVDSLVNPG